MTSQVSLFPCASSFLCFSLYSAKFRSPTEHRSSTCHPSVPRYRTMNCARSSCSTIRGPICLDLPLLSVISIELTLNQDKNNLGTFINYCDNSTNQSLWTYCDVCTMKYQTIKDVLDKAYGLSKQGDYNGVIRARLLILHVHDCKNALPQPSPPVTITEDMLLTILLWGHFLC